MSNNKDFKVKNGIQPTVYHEGLGTVVSASEGYYLAGASYDSVNFSVSGQSSYTFDFGFADSGTKMYAQKSFNGGTIYQYTLSTAYDISTASYASKSYSFANGESGFVITPDGSTLYISDNTGDAVYKYTFGTAFDVSTLGSGTQMFSTSSVDTQPDKCRFNSNGSKFFLLGRANNRIYEYSVSTAYDLSTASYSNNSLLVSSQAAGPLGFDLSSDGTKLIVSDNTTDSVYLYNLSTGFDITTASYSGTNFSLASQDSVPSGVSFNPSGSKMFVLGNANNTVFQYSTALATAQLDLSTGSVFDYTPTSDVQVTLANPAASGTVSGATLLLGSEDAAGVASTFSTTLYAGTGAAQTITNGIDLAGEGGLTWIKVRSQAQQHALFDTERGATKYLKSSSTGPESTRTDTLTSFNSNGFSLGNDSSGALVNTSGQDYASWTFKKQAKFFDIVTWTGNGTHPRTFNHSLNCSIGFMATQETNASGNWTSFHRGLANGFGTGRVYLNTTNSVLNESLEFLTSNNNSFTLTSDRGLNSNGVNYVAYLFAHDTDASSIIKCGSYTGNGSSGGNSVSIGWEPQFVIIKNTSATADWVMFDTKRGVVTGGSAADDKYLFPNGTNSEGGGIPIDFTSTGFEVFDTAPRTNASGNSFIYMAIRAENIPTITYDPTLEWSGGTAPTAPANGETDVVTFNTRDGGSTYQGVLAIDGAK